MKYRENNEIDFDDFFEDIIGVTVVHDKEPQKVLLQIDNELAPYIENKPLHGSQKIKQRHDNHIALEIFVQINYELISLLLSFGEQLIVQEPQELKDRIIKKAKSMVNNYL